MKILKELIEIAIAILAAVVIAAWTAAAVLGPLVIVKYCVLYLFP